MSNHSERSRLYREAHGEPARVEAVEEGVSIEIFPFYFDPSGGDPGYVMFTNGMSDRRMHLDVEAQQELDAGNVRARAELLWMVREPAPFVADLRWLASFPWIDQTWLGWGHTIPMPAPILPDLPFTTYFFLTPVIRRHTELADRLRVDEDPVELLVVHLLTPAEYEHKRANGVNAMLDLFDKHAYPLVFDPQRASMV